MVGTSLDPLNPLDSAVKCVNAHPVFWPETGLFGFACRVLLSRSGDRGPEGRNRTCPGKGDANVTVSETHLVMHGLAIKKHATPEAVAGIVGLDVEDVRAALGKLVEAKRVVEARGKYLLAPAARMALDADYSWVYEGARANPDFVAGYEAFERLNGSLKQLITEWQTIDVRGEVVPNDHSDKAYDDKIIDRLGDLHERAETALGQLAQALPRFSIYRAKLSGALEKAEDGAIEWVSDAKIESYHTLWFELHEDLLRLMRRERQE